MQFANILSFLWVIFYVPDAWHIPTHPMCYILQVTFPHTTVRPRWNWLLAFCFNIEQYPDIFQNPFIAVLQLFIYSSVFL